MDHYRINNLMDKAKLDVIVLFSAENIFYLTQSPTVLRLKDFQQTRPNSSRLIITIKEKNKNESILLVPEFDYKENKRLSNKVKLFSYKQYFMNPILFLAKILKSMAFANKKIGLEMSSLSTNYFLLLKEYLPLSDFYDIKNIMEEVRSIKTDEEIRKIKNTVNLMDKAFLKSFKETKVGDSEFSVHNNIIRNLYDLGCIPDYSSSKTHIGKIMKEVHKKPRSNKKIKIGDLIRTDFSASFNGYVGNLSRMAVVGKPSKNQINKYKILKSVHKKTIEFIKPGIKASDIWEYSHKMMKLAGVYHPIPEGTMIGHSIGVNVHEEPMILKNNHKLIKENMIIVIEPVICKEFFQIQDHILVQKNNSILISKKFKTNQLYII